MITYYAVHKVDPCRLNNTFNHFQPLHPCTFQYAHHIVYKYTHQ